MKAIRLLWISLLAVPMLAFAKGDTVRILLSQPGKSVAVTEQSLLAAFRFGPGPGNYANGLPRWQPRSWIVEDWERPVDEPARSLVRQQATFQLLMHSGTTREYIVVFVHDPATGQGYVHLPGAGEPSYEINAQLMRRGENYDGKWFRATHDWTRMVVDALGATGSR